MDNSLLFGKRVLAVCMETTAGGKNYSGGLGALYGDTTRTMYRMNKNYLAVTLVFQNGYVQQQVTSEEVIDEYPPQNLSNDYIDTGIILPIPLLGTEIKVKVWRNRKLPIHYGLDTNLPENGELSQITNILYGENGIGSHDGNEQRMMQEIVLGVGAIKLCRHLGYPFEVLHLNEGHGIFAALHLIQFYREVWGYTFEQAFDTVKERTVFTTHTPIGAGNRSFPIQTIMNLGGNQGLTYEQLQWIGADENSSMFSATAGALRMSRMANAVAFRHQPTSRELWRHVDRACPITYIDNGVDIKFWQSENIAKAYQEQSLRKLYLAHRENKRILIKEIFNRNGIMLDENSIIIGFAKRVVQYKRATLIFNNISKFEELIHRFNLQIVFSGKAHPKDWESKRILQSLFNMSKRYPNNVVFLQNYDVEVAGLMTKGCDVWLGNPRIPQEACSTSGMKAACNGVLNLSTPDGWWYKSAKDFINGWTFGEKESHEDDVDAKYLYDMLENHVLPTYADSKAWAKMMMASVYMAYKDCSTERMCEDYYTELYNF